MNTTSDIIFSLAVNVDNIQHTTLQNRTAIDFCSWHKVMDVKSLKEYVV